MSIQPNTSLYSFIKDLLETTPIDSLQNVKNEEVALITRTALVAMQGQVKKGENIEISQHLPILVECMGKMLERREQRKKALQYLEGVSKTLSTTAAGPITEVENNFWQAMRIAIFEKLQRRSTFEMFSSRIDDLQRIDTSIRLLVGEQDREWTYMRNINGEKTLKEVDQMLGQLDLDKDVKNDIRQGAFDTLFGDGIFSDDTFGEPIATPIAILNGLLENRLSARETKSERLKMVKENLEKELGVHPKTSVGNVDGGRLVPFNLEEEIKGELSKIDEKIKRNSEIQSQLATAIEKFKKLHKI